MSGTRSRRWPIPLSARFSVLAFCVLLAHGLIAPQAGRIRAEEPRSDSVSSAPSEPALRLALLPFLRDQGVSDAEYEQIFAAFHLAVSREKDLNLVSRMELARIFADAARGPGQPTDRAAAMYDLAVKNNIDIIIFGEISTEERNLFRARDGRDVGIRAVGLEVQIASVARRQVFNRVSWSTSHLTGGEGRAGDDKIVALSSLAASKLLWRGAQIYPVDVTFDSNLSGAPTDRDETYKNEIRTVLESLQLPPGAEIDSVRLWVREKSSISTLGIVGCVTLVGWLFVPTDDVETELRLEVEVKLLEPGGPRLKTVSESGNDRHSFGAFAAPAEKMKAADDLLKRLASSARGRLAGDPDLFQDRRALLRDFWRPVAP